MSIQTDLQAVTNEIAAARLAHMEAEVARLVDRRRYLETMVTLTVNRAANDALHIAYADNGDRDPIGVLPTLNGDDETELPF